MNERATTIKRKIKDSLKKLLTKRYHISLSNLNKTHYYVIRRKVPWAGFFSNYLYVAGHIEYALKKGYTPIIDMENYPTLYNEKNELMGTMNGWEYYFEQPTEVKLKDVYKSRNYILSDISTMGEFLPYKEDFNKFEINWRGGHSLNRHIQEYIRLKPHVKEAIEAFIASNIEGNKVLGVHYRGTDKKVEIKDHFMSVSLDNCIDAVKKCITKYQVDKILLCTDEKDAISRFESEFPGMVFYSSSFRAGGNDTVGLHFKKNVDRENHHYLLGLEVLCDMYYLAACDYLVFSHSNVTTAALILNDNKYTETFFIQE